MPLKCFAGAQVAQWIRLLAHNQKVVSSNLVQAVTCSPRLPRGTLNRGAVCVRMHLRTCADLKEPGWPSESLGVRKQADTQHACDFCKQKTAEVGTAGPMWRISAAVRKPLILIGWSWECSAQVRNKQTNWKFTTFWLGFNYGYTCTFYFVSLLRRSQTTCQL